MKFDSTWTFRFAPYCKYCKAHPLFDVRVRNHRTIIVLKCCGDIYGGSSDIV